MLCVKFFWRLCWSSIDQVLIESLSISIGQVAFSCRSSISWQIDQQSVEVASVVCQQCTGGMLVEYREGISGVSVDNWHRLESVDSWPSDVLLSVEYQPTDRPTVDRDSISSVSAVYWWTVSWVFVMYRWCIGWQLPSLLSNSSPVLSLCYKVPNSWHAVDTIALYVAVICWWSVGYPLAK